MTDREIFWPPDLIMHEAMALQRLAHCHEADRANHARVHTSATAAPVLLALAAEIALKAWQCRERAGQAPDRTHDLVKLFDGLGKDARVLLERAMPAHPDLLAQLAPVHAGIRGALDVNRDLFETWRYPYEHRGLIAETGALKTALVAIVETYWRFVPSHAPVPSTTGPAGSGPVPSSGSSGRRKG